MAGDQRDDELPRLDEGDEANESTIATGSPVFDAVLAGQIASPISEPPPAPLPAAGRPPTPATPLEPFRPPTPPARVGPSVPSPGPPRVAGAGGAPKGRPQTMIGVAPPPPAAGARPAQPFARTMAMPGAKDVGSARKAEAPKADEFGLDAGAADAARAATRPVPPAAPTPRSPAANAAFARAPARPPAFPSFGVQHPLGEDAETSTLSLEDLETARRNALPELNADVDLDDEESTRAVPRDSLVRQPSFPDGQVVVGSGADVVGEDATLAVGAANNAAAQPEHVAAYAAALAADAPVPYPSDPGLGGAQWSGPQSQPSWQQQPHSQPMQPGYGGGWQQDPMQAPQGSWSPQQQVTGPHMMPPQGYPGHGAQPMQPQGWGAPNAGGRMRISGQILLLGVVGVICLAIFITGIVLFATTKF